jgi:hypothetical protein
MWTFDGETLLHPRILVTFYELKSRILVNKCNKHLFTSLPFLHRNLLVIPSSTWSFRPTQSSPRFTPNWLAKLTKWDQSFLRNHGQIFRPLDPIVFSATMVWRRSVSLPSLFPRPRSRRRNLTGRPLSSPVWPLPDRSASPYLSRLGWPLRSVKI